MSSLLSAKNDESVANDPKNSVNKNSFIRDIHHF